MINEKFYKRRFVITAIIIVVVLIYICNLFALQVIDKSTKDQAEGISLVHQTIYPSRGLIYDRNGKLLVYNQPMYEVTITMYDLGKTFDTIGFCNTLNISRDFFDERVEKIKKTRNYSRHKPQVFLSSLEAQDIAALQESLWKYDGIRITKRTLRDYTYSAASHVLGSVGEVSQRDIDRDEYYNAGDYAGRSGIERTYERILRGDKGVEIMMRDKLGRIQGSYKDGEEDKLPHAGEDITLTIDIELQMLAEKLLQGKVGSVVAIEPKTGEVLVMASNPAWNPQLLVGKDRNKNYRMLENDPIKPLLNRATQATYPPGSTFKTLQTLVCLQEGAITPNTQYPCSGPSSTPIKCTHHHGSPVSLTNALEQSCNPYFWYAFRDMLEKDGYGKNNEKFRARYNLWRDDMLKFGLSQTFADSDIPSQKPGNIPSEKYFTKAYKDEKGWKAMTIRSLAIGQGEVLETPLQLANEAAIISNSGYYITPHLLKNDTMLTHVHETGFDKKHFKVVQQGMYQMMEAGTGRHNKMDSVAVCGKTGTAQNSHGKDNALFIGFAPKDDPQIAIAVVVENAGFGATWAVPIATLLMEKYLLGEVKHKDRQQYIQTSVLNSDVKKW